MKRILSALVLAMVPIALASPAMAAGMQAPAANGVSIALFLVVIAITLGITWWAARRTRTASDFYTAGGQITGLQNGLAIAGDAMSAGALLGLTALVCSKGFDGLFYAVGYTTGLPIVVFLMAGRMRRLGRFTFIDVVGARLDSASIRIFSACASLIIVLFYLVAQMVGAGQLIEILFGIDYLYAVLLVGALMVLYVTFGGMMATTWVQIVKAVLMISGCALLCFLVLRQTGFSYGTLLADSVSVHTAGPAILAPTSFAKNPLSAFSLGIALMLGTAGLPHVLMRFFTVPDERAARSSVLWATILMNAFYAMIFIIGFGALYLLRKQPQLFDAHGGLVGGGNTAALHLAYVLGGNPLFGFLAAVAFATILAVVAGLTLSGASSISHDIYGSLTRARHGEAQDSKAEMKVMKVAVVVIGALAVILSLAFRTQNIAYMISLAFSISCSSTFPVLILAIYWKRFTTLGALCGGGAGLAASLLLTILGPSIWVTVLGHAAPAVPIDPPAIITVPLAFAVSIVVSLLERSPAHATPMSELT
ncbi:sodium:solute symporter family transporter [Paraburkholderia sp. BCC1886]|uniref:sodium:solute symporter family transporter n=1 Tax=Paraburkholderia sp. BCC1886 TaxID=2562670 RepID=UPI00118269BB|nr:sodium/solute symporter [Paraburkholderia sp. BCC1886]